MLDASEQASLSTALDDLSRAVDLAKQAAERSDPWWRHVLPYETDVDRAADSAATNAQSLAALSDALHAKADQLATAEGYDHATAAEYVKMAQDAAKRWTAVTDLANAIQARPSEVIGAAASTVAGAASSVVEGVGATAKALPWIAGVVAVLAVFMLLRRRAA